MRLSCNGCRVLRKGCSDACTIRPCLQWIKSSDAQANATVFLAKFYGRAGLLNLIAAAPTDALRPAVFRSLLYEACGRIVNPVYGAVGLLWSGTWHMCQDAVEAVLKGAPIVQVSADDAAAAAGPPINAAAAAAAAAAAYDIRHVFPKSSSSNKQSHAAAGAPPPPAAVDDAAAAQSRDDKDKHTGRGLLRKVSKPQFKRTSSSPSPLKKTKTTTQNKQPHLAALPATEYHNDDMLVADHSDEEQQHAAVRDQVTNSNAKSRRASSDDCDRHSASASLDTHDTEAAASHVSQAVAEAEPQQDDQQAEAEQQPPSMGLDLTLGLLTSSAPPPMDLLTPAGCRLQGGGSSAAVDEPAGIIGFRFL
ncbi:unnamed protein product [Miscanthus lutarioriparius]|uniref:LOB domain-containing protein n=1 Tax=Miscanthus lutarioriparius TaxID=422564 RepID=A0A811RTZ7_9POAL|nr:unnamed protein product [Miscanthus lutarioriparius]